LINLFLPALIRDTYKREREDIQQSLSHLLETNHKQHSKGFLPQERAKKTLIQDHTRALSILLK
jgi:hypothetical protein